MKWSARGCVAEVGKDCCAYTVAIVFVNLLLGFGCLVLAVISSLFA